MTAIASPSAYFIPWMEMKQRGYLAEFSLDIKKPIHWAQIPKEVHVYEWRSIPILPGQQNDPDIVWLIAQEIIGSSEPVLILGEEAVLTSILEQFEQAVFSGDRNMTLILRYTKDMLAAMTVLHYVQYLPESLEIHFLPDLRFDYVSTLS